MAFVEGMTFLNGFLAIGLLIFTSRCDIEEAVDRWQRMIMALSKSKVQVMILNALRGYFGIEGVRTTAHADAYLAYTEMRSYKQQGRWRGVSHQEFRWNDSRKSRGSCALPANYSSYALFLCRKDGLVKCKNRGPTLKLGDT